MSLQELLSRIRATPDCEVYPSTGLPVIKEEHVLPDDLRDFYERCGGVSLHRKQPTRFCIVPPTQLVLANPVLEPVVSQEQLDAIAHDISWSWYIIAHDWGGNYLTIDLSKDRLGRCYDSFFGYHAMPGYCKIIARSFTELLTRLYENRGKARYWDRPDFAPLGDAYNGIDYKRGESP